jgi:hypothetical protein
MASTFVLPSRPRASQFDRWRRPLRLGSAVVLAAIVVLTAAAAAQAPSPREVAAEAAVAQGGPGTPFRSAAPIPAPSRSSEPEVVAEPVAQTPRYFGGIPKGTGMWTWKPEETENGNPRAVIRKAVEAGLSHIYVRTGSSWQGFHGADYLDEILPRAHKAGIRVYGWDFPSMVDLEADLERARTAIDYRTPGGHRIDGFVADIETGAEGTDLSGGKAGAYGRKLRKAVGDDEVLIACVPNPTAHHLAIFPYDSVLGPYDAIAPMIYWLNRQPDTDTERALDILRSYGKPLLPVGQAYDGAPEGGRPGPPPAEEIERFIASAREGGARAISFWSWQHASPEIWQAITDNPLRRPGD